MMKKVFLICAAVIAIFGCIILVINPTFADTIYDENNFFENMTTAACIIALAFSLVLLSISYRKRSGYGFWLFFTLLLFIFVGDEISWGMEFFGLAKHKISGIDFDGVHDVLSISIGTFKLIRDYIISIGILDIRSLAIIIGSVTAVITLIYFLIKSVVNNRKNIYSFFSKNLRWEPFFFLLIGLILILIAMIIDDDNLVGFPHKAVVEESLELTASISLLFSCLSGFKGKKRCTT